MSIHLPAPTNLWQMRQLSFALDPHPMHRFSNHDETSNEAWTKWNFRFVNFVILFFTIFVATVKDPVLGFQRDRVFLDRPDTCSEIFDQVLRPGYDRPASIHRPISISKLTMVLSAHLLRNTEYTIQIAKVDKGKRKKLGN